MLPLPTLVTGSSRWGLPMAENSAAAIIEALLATGPGEAAKLAEAFAGDPPLMLWIVARAAREGVSFGAAREAAAGFSDHAPRILAWDDDVDGVNADEADLWSDRVAGAIELAEAAAMLVPPDDSETAARAYLAGLLHEASAWFASDASSAAEVPETPSWPLPDASDAISVITREAIELLRGSLTEKTSRDLVEECRRRAAVARTRWLQPIPWAAALLPKLVARLARMESAYRERLEAEKLESMAEFAAGAGHEINNPLAVIAGRAQLFLRDETDPERRRGLALINAQAKRVYEMIADMMLFARPPAPVFEKIDLVALVDRIVAELGPRMLEQATTLSRSGESAMLEIEADPTQLTVALRAMCRNALEAIGHGGHVDLVIAQSEDYAEIQVVDDGPGIGENARRHLFDPYYSAREAGRGLGLGLSKCWRIVVTNHGGRIDVESQSGQPTVFTITLPKRQTPND